MTEYTYLPTEEQEVALTSIVNRINGDSKELISNEDYFRARANDLLNKYVVQEVNVKKEEFIRKYEQAGIGVKVVVEDMLKDVGKIVKDVVEKPVVEEVKPDVVKPDVVK